MIEMNLLFAEMFVAGGLIFFHGLLTMAETSLTAIRKSELEKLSKRQEQGTKEIPEQSQPPVNLILTLQAGITLAALSVGVYAGSTFLDPFCSFLIQNGFPALAARGISALMLIISLGLFIIIFGKMIPKQIALHAPHVVARWVVRPVFFFARIFQPVFLILTKITDAIGQLLGMTPALSTQFLSHEDIKSFLQESAKHGAFDATEERMVQGVIAFSEARISSFMTPRPEIVWLDIDEPSEKNRKKIIDARHSHFPVVKGSLDNVVGVIHVKDILGRLLLGEPFDLTLYLEQALFLPENADASRSVDLFKNSATHFAFIVDEYGNIQGVVTLTDILRAIVGDFADTMDDKSTTILKRKDGTWVVDGLVTVQELRERLMLPKLRGEDSGNFHTVAGFMLSELGKIPRTTDAFEWDGVRFEVIDMDGHRVDKVLITLLEKGR
jgi:putative hemolysin